MRGCDRVEEAARACESLDTEGLVWRESGNRAAFWADGIVGLRRGWCSSAEWYSGRVRRIGGRVWDGALKRHARTVGTAGKVSNPAFESALGPTRRRATVKMCSALTAAIACTIRGRWNGRFGSVGTNAFCGNSRSSRGGSSRYSRGSTPRSSQPRGTRRRL